jgi:hypothetical protein
MDVVRNANGTISAHWQKSDTRYSGPQAPIVRGGGRLGCAAVCSVSNNNNNNKRESAGVFFFKKKKKKKKKKKNKGAAFLRYLMED